MKEKEKGFPKTSAKFLLHYIIKNRLIFFMGLLVCSLEVAAEKMAPLFFSKITGLFIDGAEYESIKGKLFLLLLLYIAMELLTRLFYYISKNIIDIRLAPKLAKDIAQDLFLYLHSHSIEYFANNMPGKLADKLKGAAEISATIIKSSMFFIKVCFNFAATIFLFATINITFSMSYLVIIIASWVYFFKISKKVLKKRKILANARSEVSGNFIDAIQNMFFVKIFNGQKHEEALWYETMQDENKKYKSYIATDFMQTNSKFFFYNFLNIAYLIYALYLWKEGQIKPEDVVFIFFLIRQTTNVLEMFLHMIIQFNSNKAELEAYLEPFYVEHDIKDSPRATKLKVKNGKIEIKNISFAYKKGKDIFKDFSLSIKPNEKIGIVGHSGCGKTTLISLIQRLYDVDGGKICIDGKNIKKVSQDSLRQNISYISQHSQLFDRSLRENIAYGKPKAKDNVIIAAAKNAYAHDFISEQEDGYNTVLKGTKKLSGGQLQRISIARALLEDAPILILDEATSSLDSQSEAYIQKAITKLIKNKTVIAIAHRLSTLKNMDRIVVIEDGEIIEDGSIKKLLAKGGKFAEFWNLQALKEEKFGK